VDAKIKKYLSQIGQNGGRKSRRVLTSEDAQNMVKVREARRAFKNFYTLCFWSCDPGLKITITDVPWVVEQLFKHGNRSTLPIIERLQN